MPLPDLIEIVPLDNRVCATVTVPGSKSITNRALILAALADGETTLHGALWSEDTQVMVECLQELSFMVNVAPDPHESCNRTITLYGKGGQVPAGGTEEQPLDLFVGNAGTAARFLVAFVCLGKGAYRLSGVPRMHERPQAALFEALRQLGYRVDAPNNKLPAVIHGTGPLPGQCTVSIEQSSQFASALLLSAAAGGWEVRVAGDDTEEASYVRMTSKMIDAFPANRGNFHIEPDASSGSYFLAANRLAPPATFMEHSNQFGVQIHTELASSIAVANWPHSGWQIDEQFPKILHQLDLDSRFADQLLEDRLSPQEMKSAARQIFGDGTISRARDLGDSIMTMIVLGSFARGPIRFTDLGRLRLQECERVMALRTELTRCGANVIESRDSLEFQPSELHGAKIDTYNDHRMAMSFAILGLKVHGIEIKNPACVKKTFPNFFQKLAGAQPHGLGATIRDAKTGEKLALEDLFAE